jgi:hypothetical protein
MNRTRSGVLFVELVAWLGLASLVSCVSSDDVPGPGRVEHPGPGAKAPPTPTSPASSPEPTSGMSEPSEHPPAPAEVKEPPSGFQPSPLDKAIAEDYPERPWSKNVPKRDCKDDSECGDGFCDRGSCAAIWTSDQRYGQRCDSNRWCGSRPCIDGRCRSCISDAECTWARHMQAPKCIPDSYLPGSRECNGVVGSGPIIVSPGPPPQRPKQ